jgi:hypothetical protein
MWVNRVEKDPNNADMHLGLANALFVAGDKEGAIGELRRVAELRPTMKTQVEELISQIISGAVQP